MSDDLHVSTGRSSVFSDKLTIRPMSMFPLTQTYAVADIVSDRIRRLALHNTGSTTGFGTASVHRSLTVPTEA
jgi:hypothetical protein